MLGVDEIGKIRRAHFREGRSIKAISRDLDASRATVRKVLRSGATSFAYERRTQPRPKVGPWQSKPADTAVASRLGFDAVEHGGKS